MINHRTFYVKICYVIVSSYKFSAYTIVKVAEINTFKPSGYYMYQQVWRSKLFRSSPQIALYVFYDDGNNQPFFHAA
jgi:hypothetical protein